LAQDASFRRYLRLTGGPRPAMLMDAPPPEDVRPFLRVAAHIAGTGLSAPEIIAADETNGLLLEEDLGDGLIATLTLDRHTPPILTTVIDCLVALQRASPPPGLPLWNADAMAQTALGTLLDWWWPAAFHAPAPSAARDDFAAALATMLYPLTCCPLCFVHRDFFAGNLLWLPQREGLRRIGILDFQTAALGHPAYDLVSLLQDARQDSHGPPATEDQAISLYLAARPELDPLAFRTAYAICAAQRHLRVACQWVRLAVRDRRRHYLAYGPRTWRLLESALSHQAAAPLAAAMDRWIPPSRRGNPQGLAA
jgi:N-acetylmuramate 1-kinase